jgi:hypothetical protein
MFHRLLFLLATKPHGSRNNGLGLCTGFTGARCRQNHPEDHRSCPQDNTIECFCSATSKSRMKQICSFPGPHTSPVPEMVRQAIFYPTNRTIPIFSTSISFCQVPIIAAPRPDAPLTTRSFFPERVGRLVDHFGYSRLTTVDNIISVEINFPYACNNGVCGALGREGVQ